MKTEQAEQGERLLDLTGALNSKVARHASAGAVASADAGGIEAPIRPAAPPPSAAAVPVTPVSLGPASAAVAPAGAPTAAEGTVDTDALSARLDDVAETLTARLESLEVRKHP